MLLDTQAGCVGTGASVHPAENPALAADALRQLRAENEALRERLTALSRSNVDLEQFSWAASHDLKEPLRTIAGYIQLLFRRRPPVPGSEESEWAAGIEKGIERLHAMIDGLLDYARAGRSKEESDMADAGAIAADAIDSLHELMAERKAIVTLDPLPPVAVPPTLVLQVFVNLIGNALKYCPANLTPLIEIFGSDEDAMVRLAVRDNGIGIESEYRSRIFEPFQRLHGDEYPGIGLGLALSKRLVESRGGRIWVESQPGAGSTFYFTLPRVKASEAVSGTP